MALPKLEVPTYTAKLPSSGQNIIYRPFLVKEHKILLTLMQSDVAEISRVVTDLVDACTFKKLDIQKLASFDIEYLFLLLRARSIGETMDLVMTCKKCEHKNEITVNLLEASVDKNKDHSNVVKISSDISIVMNYPKIKDTLYFFNNSNQDEVFNFVVSSIESIVINDEVFEAKDQTKEELDNFVNSMTKDQFDKLESFFLTMPKLTQKINKTCENCNELNETVLEGLENFFV
jgi:hypothetical protein